MSTRPLRFHAAPGLCPLQALSESSEVPAQLLGVEVESALRKWERYLHSIHITDEFVAMDG